MVFGLRFAWFCGGLAALMMMSWRVSVCICESVRVHL